MAGTLATILTRWFSSAGDAALAGGQLRFWESGTSTLKTIYADPERTIPAPNPLPLSAGGAATFFLGPGAYRVGLYTAAGVQVESPVDGVTADGGFGIPLDGSIPVLETYADLRALDGSTGRAAVVLGRLAPDDGGAGLFAWSSGLSVVDNDGTILSPTTNPISGRWLRSSMAHIDPRWFGAAINGTTNDSAALSAALSASAFHGLPVSVHGGALRLASSVATVASAALEVAPGASLTATSSVIVLSVGVGHLATFRGVPRCFGGDLSVSFGTTADAVADVAWWDRTTDDARLAAAIASQESYGGRVIVRDLLSMGLNLETPESVVVQFEGLGAMLWATDASAAVRIRRIGVIGDWRGRIRATNASSITSVVLDGVGSLPPEFFGAVGDGTTDDSIPVKLAMQHGDVSLRGQYYIGSALEMGTGESVIFRGSPDGSVTSIPPEIRFRNTTAATMLRDGPFRFIGPLTISTPNDPAAKVTFESAALDLRDVTVTGSAPLALEGPQVLRDVTATAPMYLLPSSADASSAVDVTLVEGGRISGGEWALERFRGSVLVDGSMKLRLAVDSTFVAVGSVSGSSAAIYLSYEAIIRGGSFLSNPFQVDFVTGGRAIWDGCTFSGSVVGTVEHLLTFDWTPKSFSNVRWNGLGAASTKHRAPYPNFNFCSLNQSGGIPGPASMWEHSSELRTESTTGWTFSPSTAPMAIDGSLFWSGDAGVQKVMERTISTDTERLLNALGGYVRVDVTGKGVSYIGAQFLVDGVEVPDEAIGTLVPGSERATTHKTLIPFWCGRREFQDDGATPRSSVLRVIVGDGIGSMTDLSVRVEIFVGAPRTEEQWNLFWASDHDLDAPRFWQWEGTIHGSANGAGGPAGLRLSCDAVPEAVGGHAPSPRPNVTTPALSLMEEPIVIYPRSTTYNGEALMGTVPLRWVKNRGPGLIFYAQGVTQL